METLPSISINAQRLLSELEVICKIGADEAGGVTRLAYDSADLTARSWFINKAELAGLEVTIDPVGNILALEPSAGDTPAVLSGSHLDTVPQGGRFDGMLGVLSALEAVRAIREQTHDPNRRPLGVLMLAAEESSRFGSGCLGSRMIVGDVGLADLNKLKDANGVTLFQAMRRVGLKPSLVSDAICYEGWFHEFIEIHIDQGVDLRDAQIPVGIVNGIAAPTRLWITINGQRAHSGATLMDQRHDALTGAAEVVLAIEQAGRQRLAQEIVATVGIMNIKPGAMNVIAGEVEIGVDIRGIDLDSVREVYEEVVAMVHRVADERGLSADIDLISFAEPRLIDEPRIAALEAIGKQLNIPTMRIVSRAAHDALYLGQHGAVSMLFVRNPAGISHNPAEAAYDEDIVQGAQILANYMAQTAAC